MEDEGEILVNSVVPSSNGTRHLQKEHQPQPQGSMEEDITYYSLLQSNRSFRLFFLSYVINHLGEWFTYLASITAIEQINNEQPSKTAISLLILVRLLPYVLFLPFGGVLADGRDRRKSMIALDLLGAAVVLLFLEAVRWRSVTLIYTATFLQECVSSLYEPSRSSIVPLLAPQGDELQKATYLTGMAWSFIAALGTAVGGFLVSAFGIQLCYCTSTVCMVLLLLQATHLRNCARPVIDSFTYLLSAALIAAMGGTWDVSTPSTSAADESPIGIIRGMMHDGARYLSQSSFGVLVLMKPSMELIWGAGDILCVSFSELLGSAEGRSRRLGMLFASSGLGCILGPLLTDKHAKMDAPTSILGLCLWGIALVSLGCFLMGIFANQLRALYIAIAIRAMGSSIVWVNSALLLQKFSAPDMLGRVTSIELAFTLMAQIVSAMVAGVLEDQANWTPDQLSFALCGLSSLFFVPWTGYYIRGRGDADYEPCKVAQVEPGLEKKVSEKTGVVNELTSLLADTSGTPLLTRA